jgi:LmbE family N-acetylglucosaminyl deacetylase
MKKTLLAIFAHPDDEAFGPAGTLAEFSNTYDVQLVCVTNGEKGENRNSVSDLKELRKKEVQKSAEILGISHIHFLNFPDGSLNNSIYPDMCRSFKEIIATTNAEELMTFEPLGFSGHLDHIAVTSVLHHLFHNSDNIKKLYLHCLHEKQRSFVSQYFVYFPRGYSDKEIDFAVDVQKNWNKKKSAIHAHASQKNDIDFWLPIFEKSEKKEYFLIMSK